MASPLPGPASLPGPPDPGRPGPLDLPTDLVLRLAGYRRPAEAEPEVRRVAGWAAGRVGEVARVESRLGVLEVTSAGPAGVTLVDRLAGPEPGAPDRPADRPPTPPAIPLTGSTLGRLLAGCPLAVAFVLTLGPDVEAEAGRLAESRQILESYLLDTAGWALLEVAARRLRRDLATRWAPAGLRPTHRLGPGHGDWPLEEQARLLALLDLGPASGGRADPVRLSEHGVLVPFKSISGLFGLRSG